MSKGFLFAIFTLTIFTMTSQPVFPGEKELSRNVTIESFSKAKKLLLREIYTDYHQTFYCGCTFSGKEITKRNGYVPRRDNKRANRIEWEHVVPAHAFGQSFSSWRDGDEVCRNRKGKPFKGRNCARKVDQEFRFMEADLHNLVPAVGEINGLRSNYSFAMIPGEPRKFGSCDMEIEDRKAEPPENVRGDIARIYKYMDAAYPGRGIISKKNCKLYDAWDRQDPVDAWECEKERRVAKIQKNRNWFVADICHN
jgi:deoxyribonuclease-1